MRKTSLTLAVALLAVAAAAWIVITVERGWVALSLLFLLPWLTPVMFLLSLLALVLAFWKTEEMSLDAAAKVASVLAVAAFGVGSIIALPMLLS